VSKKYRFNVGDKVLYIVRGPAVDTDDPTEVERVRGQWCWTTGSEHDWCAFDRMTGNQRENPIPGFAASIKHDTSNASGV